MRTQLQEARWLLKSLEIRNETLMKVARSIVERQPAFLEHGEEHMQPMILRDIAEAIEMHESTDLARHLRQVHAHAARRVRAQVISSRARSKAATAAATSSTAIRAKIRS